MVAGIHVLPECHWRLSKHSAFDSADPHRPLLRQRGAVSGFRQVGLHGRVPPANAQGRKLSRLLQQPGPLASLYADPSIASHVLEKTLRWHDAQSRRWAAGLMLLGVFRCLPQAGKRFLEGPVARITPSLAWDDAYGRETLPMGPRAPGDAQAPSGDIAFFRAMTSLSSATMEAPAFKYYHLWGIHAPLLHDERLRPFAGRYTRENAKHQAKGTFRLLWSFIETMTKLHIYDQSLLLIVADHGTEFQPFRPRLVEVDRRLRTGGGPPRGDEELLWPSAGTGKADRGKRGR